MNGGILKAVKLLTANKLRTFLTVSGIAVGVMSVIIISIIGETGKGKIDVMLANMGMDNIIVTADAALPDRLAEEDLKKIRRIPEVKNAMPLMNMTAKADIGAHKSDCMLWGVNEDADNVIELLPVYGRLINKGDVSSGANVCVIDEELALDSYSRSNIIGKKIGLNLNGSVSEYEIVGVVKNGANLLQSMLGNIIPSFVYIPYTTMQDKITLDCFDQIAVKLNNDVSNIENEIKHALSFERSHSSSINVENLLTQKDKLTDIMEIITILLSVIAGISLIVSGLSIMNVMLVSVNERKREIGIKKSIGASNSIILKEFLTEAAIITATGTVLGTVLGILVCVGGCALFNISIAISADIILGTTAFSGIAGVIFGVYPAYKAAKLRPVDALRNDA